MIRITVFVSGCLVTFFCLCSFVVSAQSWMSGYEFRKKITFDKSKIEGDFINSGNGRIDYDVADFAVLVELQDKVFKYQPVACDGILHDDKGRNVAFALVSAPTVKLNFQIDSYDPVLGKYRFWVRIPMLASAKTATPATAVYFYYGGSVLHEHNSAESLGTWSGDYTGVWHMNAEDDNFSSPNGKTGMAEEQLFGHHLSAESKVDGKIGKAVAFDGVSQYLHTVGSNNNGFTFSCWIKWNGGADPQVIAASDSVAAGKKMGWQLKINSDGKLSFTTYRSASQSFVVNSSTAVVPQTWTLINCSYSVSAPSNSALTIFINGASNGSISGSGLRLSYPTGYLSIGRAKDGTQHFNGTLDELQISSVGKPIYWLRNEYKNQSDPVSFYAVSVQEYSPSWAVFTGSVNSNWTTTGNWQNGLKPVWGGKLRIAAGKTTKMTGIDLTLAGLVLEPGALLSSSVNLQFNCNASIAAGAKLSLDAGKKLILAGDDMTLSGEGMVSLSDLEINGSTAKSKVHLNTTVHVSNSLKLMKGELYTYENLTLLADKQTAASVLPVPYGQSIVTGNVNVQRFVDGSFPEPSSGRGWRLLSSPVVLDGLKAYGISAFKETIFVTGAAGTANGFDSSPKNGATIYTHNEALPGTLSEKYVPVENIHVTIPAGRGIYVYSRGSRNAPNAYANQIVNQPFSNPAPYILTYTGRLLIGDLTVNVSNRSSGGEGDGFNLLGNPYACPIRWGSLSMEHVGPFIWLFDPLNNAYQVTDDPDTLIPAGAGFFVRVLAGFATGSVRFTEDCKVFK